MIAFTDNRITASSIGIGKYAMLQLLAAVRVKSAANSVLTLIG